MRSLLFVLCLLFSFMLSSCASYAPSRNTTMANNDVHPEKKLPNYASRLPQTINTNGQKVILVDPNVHAWGAYGPDGDLIRAGIVTAGADWCPDIGRRCHTKAGTFHIASLGSPSCKSTIYPLPKGGAPMPYCMFFNGNQGLHGSYNLAEANLSHGCVRMRVQDAEWVRYNFANVGTKVIVKPY